MGKRSSFARLPRDAYDTPPEAVEPLLPHLPATFTFLEPCAGAGNLVEILEHEAGNATCVGAFDVEPRGFGIGEGDALELGTTTAQLVITNPPWERPLLHALIMHLSDLAPTWLLIDAAWAFTRQSAPYMRRARKVVPIGRLKWIPDSPHAGKDDCAWYLFTHHENEPCILFPRVAP